MADDKLKEEERVELVEKPDPASIEVTLNAGELSPDAEEMSSTSEKTTSNAEETSRNLGDKSSSIEVDSNISIDDDAAILAGKVSFAQKVVGDRFEVLDIIGQGGMGSVYKVRDLSTDRIVAVKLLKPELCEDKATLKRFLQEAASLSELDHENIVTVYDHGITGDGAPFLIMQYLNGETLADLIARNGKLSPAQAIDLTLQICNGLYYAHMKGFIHRDIKPSNIVLIDDGTTLQVKLLDFGIAKIIQTKSAATTNLTQTGDVFGTPAYMSPEQCQGGDIDSRTDIYSLGCVLYEMLTGKQPFAGSNAIQVALKHINGTPDSFTRKLPDGDVLHSLEEIVFKCMRKEPKERFDSAIDVSSDLKAVRTGKAVGYAEAEVTKTELKDIPKPIIRIGHYVGNVLFYWTAFVLYVVTLYAIYISDPTIAFYDRSEVTAGLLGTLIFGLAIHAKGAVTTIKRLHKRRTLLEWMMALLEVLLFSLYALLGLLIGLPESTMGGDILSVAITACIVMTWCLLILICLLGPVSIARTVTLRTIHWWKNRQIPASPKFKPARVPVKFGPAFTRIGALSTALIAGFIAVNPTETSSLMSTGVYNLIEFSGSNLAVPVLNAAISLDSRNVHAYKALAYRFDQDGESEKKLEILNQGLKIAPGDPKLLIDRGEAYLTDEQYPKAAADFEKKANQHLDARIGLGKAYLGMGDFEKSYKTFTAAINETRISEGSLSEAYTGRALASYARGSYEAAIDDLSKSIEEDDGSNKSLDYVRRGLAYQAIGQRTAARHDFEKAYQGYISDADGETALVKAFCYIQIGDQPAAEKAMSDALKEDMTKDDLRGIVFPNLPSVKFKW